MSSVIVCNCPQNTPDSACLLVVSSRPSDQQQKKPDGRSLRAQPVAWNGDLMAAGSWLNVGAGGKQCPKLVCSGRSGMVPVSREHTID